MICTYLLEITNFCSSWRENVANAHRPPYIATLEVDNRSGKSQASSWARRKLLAAACKRNELWWSTWMIITYKITSRLAKTNWIEVNQLNRSERKGKRRNIITALIPLEEKNLIFWKNKALSERKSSLLI